MADRIYKVRDPSGAVREIRGPEGATDAEVIAQAKKMLGERPVAKRDPDFADRLVGSKLGRFVIGTAEPILGLASRGASALGDQTGVETMARLRKMQARGREASGSEGFDWMGLLGNVASPANLVTGQIPAAGLAGRVAQGAGVGALAGASAVPGEDVDQSNVVADTAKHAAAGGLFGTAAAGAAEVARPILQAGYRAIEPTFEGGRKAILKRYQEGLLGDSKDEVIAALIARTKPSGETFRGRTEPSFFQAPPGELVPGSVPTAGELLSDFPGVTGIAAHQKAVAKAPEVSGAFVAREQGQETARRYAMGRIARGKETLAAAESKRTADSLKNYGAAYATKIKADPELLVLSEDPFFKKTFSDVIEMEKSKGITPKTDLTRVLHYVKVSLDKALGKTGDDSLSNTQREAVASVKERLVDWMVNKNPAYGKARDEFAAASRPINQMEVGGYLQDKLTAPIASSERAAQFAQAVRDAPGTLKKSTGFKRYEELTQVLTSQQMKVVNAIMADLNRGAKYENIASKTNVGGGIDGPEALPNLLSRPAMIANFVLRQFRAEATPKINAMAGRQYLNPKELADALKDAPPSAVQRVADALLRLQNPAIGAAVYTGGH